MPEHIDPFLPEWEQMLTECPISLAEREIAKSARHAEADKREYAYQQT